MTDKFMSIIHGALVERTEHVRNFPKRRGRRDPLTPTLGALVQAGTTDVPLPEIRSWVAVVPAKLASVRLERKVLQSVGPRKLIDFTIGAAIHSKLIDRIIVATESDEVEDHVMQLQGPIDVHRQEPFPPHVSLAAIKASVFATDQLRADRYPPDATGVVMLLPTSPRRTAAQIDAAIAHWLLTRRSPLDALVSVVHREQDHGHIKSLRAGFDYTPRTVSNGAIQLSTLGALRRTLQFTRDPFMTFPMDAWHSLDIDTADDLEEARGTLFDDSQLPEFSP